MSINITLTFVNYMLNGLGRFGKNFMFVRFSIGEPIFSLMRSNGFEAVNFFEKSCKKILSYQKYVIPLWNKQTRNINN